LKDGIEDEDMVNLKEKGEMMKVSGIS